jgi:serine beta-lactamase-like protein LACTB
VNAEKDSAPWKQKGLTLLGWGVAAACFVGMGIYAFLTSMVIVLHPNAQEVPSSGHGASAQKWAAAVEKARQVAREGIRSRNLPGLSIAVGVGGELVWAEGFGWADLEKRVPVGPGTRFRIGHASKALTSAGVGLLLEKGKLRLDDEIQTHVPSFPKKQWPVTVRQLMGHVAGVTHYRGEEDYMPTSHCERASEGLTRFADHPLLFEPETRYQYSTFGWILVSAAVEAAANEPFFAFMRTRVFEPLDMGDTTIDVSTEAIPDRATFYWPRFGLAGDTRYGPKPARVGDHSCYAGAAAFLSTPSDLVRFGIGINSGKLLKPGTVQLLQTPQRVASGEETGYGLGWELETHPLAGQPTRMAGHGSKQEFIGGSTYVMTFPERGLVVAVMANISYADTKSIALNIAQAFAEQGRSPARQSLTQF